MTVIDPDVRRREHDLLVARLAEAGLVVRELEDLRNQANQTADSAALLLTMLPRVTEANIAHAIVIAIGQHRCGNATIAALVEYYQSLGTISFDEYIQIWNSRILRSDDPFYDVKAREKAKAAISQGWYLSYEPPPRSRVRAYDPTFPDAETLSAYHDVQVKTGVGNVLIWQARQDLFETIEGLLRATMHSAGRELLPEALVRCDSSRARDVLMSLLNDSGVGAHAMVQLGKLAHAPARPLIEKFLDHPIDWVRREATKALRRLDQASGRRNTARAPFEEVLPASERALGAKLVAGEDGEPQDIKGKVSAFVIGSLAEDERGWTRENCVSTSVELDDLDALFHKLAREFKGDFHGRRGKALRAEILEAEHEDWKAYTLNVRIGEHEEEVWFHYFLDDPSTVDVTIWGPADFIAKLREVLSEK